MIKKKTILIYRILSSKKQHNRNKIEKSFYFFYHSYNDKIFIQSAGFYRVRSYIVLECLSNWMCVIYAQ